MKVVRVKRGGKRGKLGSGDNAARWFQLQPEAMLAPSSVDWRDRKTGGKSPSAFAEPEPIVKIATGFPTALVDLSRRPLLFLAANDDEHKGRICINLWPKELPTVASFATEAEALTWLACVFSRSQVAKWFPRNIRR